jgi:hypothetical protein
MIWNESSLSPFRPRLHEFVDGKLLQVPARSEEAFEYRDAGSTYSRAKAIQTL